MADQKFYNILASKLSKTSNRLSPFLTLCLGSIGMEAVISELCYKKRILHECSCFIEFIK